VTLHTVFKNMVQRRELVSERCS